MDFSRKKLPKDALSTLIRARIESIQPFALMIGPAYLYMRANEKFVSVKGPMDFFVSAELERLKPFKYFYFPPFVETSLSFRDTGRRIKALLSLTDRVVKAAPMELYPEVALGPTSFELADQVLLELGPIWWDYPKEGIAVEPFLVTILVNEVCELIPPELLLAAREKDVEKLDHALFLSSWTVFLALHLGYCDLEFINILRLRIFKETIGQSDELWNLPDEVNELIQLSFLTFASGAIRKLRYGLFQKRSERVSHKLCDRLQKVKRELQNQGNRGNKGPTILGERGFIDV